MDISERTGWFTIEELTNMIAVSESTPGPIGVNMATYVGYASAGIPGAVIATLGLIAPSIIIILMIAAFLTAFRNNKYVDRAFYGIRGASAALITMACYNLVKLCLIPGGFSAIDPIVIALFAALVFLTNWKKTKKLHPLVFIALSAVIGIALKL